MAYFDATKIQIKDITVPVATCNCLMYKKLYVCHCLYWIGIKSNNSQFNNFISQYKTSAFDCRWWVNLGWNPYKNIDIINNFIKSNCNNDQWIHINTNQGLSFSNNHKKTQNIFIQCTIENETIVLNENLIYGKQLKAGRKYMFYNNQWKLTHLMDPRIMNGKSMVNGCWHCQKFYERQREIEKVEATFKVLHPNDIEWKDDKYTSKCTKCRETFTVFRRKHHCRACGEIYCGNCCYETTKKWGIMQGYRSVIVRLCILCHGKYGYCTGAKSNEFWDNKFKNKYLSS